MTKKEFVEYVGSFNKKPGKYTEDEIYKIGVAHKKLIRGEKNWEDLAKVLSLDITGEQYRKLIVRKQLRDGTLPKNTRVISTRTIEDITEEDVIQRTKQLFIQQQKTRDERNALGRTMRDESRIDSLKDAIRGTVGKLQSLPKISYPTMSKAFNKEAILLFSDLHLGVELDEWYNTFNSKIAEARVMKLVDDAIQYCKDNNVKKLNFINLGDLVHGLIHVSARIEEQFGVIEQVMMASEIISKALNKLQEAAPEIIYRSCTDNHSRTVANKSEAIEKDNFNRLVDWFLQERLKNTKIKFVNDNLSEDLGKFTLENGKKVMFSHGHLDTVNQVFQNWVGGTGEVVDFIFLGHFHNEKVKSFQKTRVYVNGSIVGPEQYANGRRLYTPPSQTLLVFDNDNIVNYSINLDIRKV
jgi:predicted phosphodiesterase